MARDEETKAAVDAFDATTLALAREPKPMSLRWNTRYEAAKPRLVQRMQALIGISDEGELAQAERMIAAIRSLPDVGEHRGSVRIVNRVATKPGDSDFVYSLFVTDQGFELRYHEEMKVGDGQWDYAYPQTLVQCKPTDSETDDESSDEEALDNMRRAVEMMFGEQIDDEEWQFQVEQASNEDVPNGILNWLEMLPVDDEGKSPETVSIGWRE